jgi:hypothetical protein
MNGRLVWMPLTAMVAWSGAPEPMNAIGSNVPWYAG